MGKSECLLDHGRLHRWRDLLKFPWVLKIGIFLPERTKPNPANFVGPEGQKIQKSQLMRHLRRSDLFVFAALSHHRFPMVKFRSATLPNLFLFDSLAFDEPC